MGEIRSREPPLLGGPIRFEAPRVQLDKVRRWTTAIAFAFVIHAAPLLMMALWPATSAPPAPMPDPLVIFMELTPPAAPIVPPSEQPPGPKRVKAEIPNPRTVRELANLPPLDVPPLVLPAAPPEPEKEEAKEAAPETTAPPARPAPPAPRPSSGQPTWEGLVLGALDRKKRFPRDAQFRREQGVPWIRFVMDREGKVLSSRLERSSGVRSLDAEAVALPRRAQPLPKPPDDVPGDTLELVVPIQFFLR